MTKRDKVTLKDIAKIRGEIDKFINSESGWQKFIGFFTFINIVWMCATCGITVTVGPCIYQCIGPYLKTCLSSVKECVIWFMKKIVLPIIDFLHSWGIFEAFFYLFCFQWIYEGSLLHVKQDTGFWVAFAGITFVMPLFFYSTKLHTKHIRSSGKSKQIVINLYMLWLLMCWIPVCVRH